MEIRCARLEDFDAYATLGREAQAWLRSHGLGQYVPAAHAENAAAIRSKIESGVLYAVWNDTQTVGFFSLDSASSPWWPADDEPALYLAGMVVSNQARGRGVGGFILHWCMAEARRRGFRFVRLDCHAGNPWLRAYYETYGFTLQAQVVQHPGYIGCLYQWDAPAETAGPGN